MNTPEDYTTPEELFLAYMKGEVDLPELPGHETTPEERKAVFNSIKKGERSEPTTTKEDNMSDITTTKGRMPRVHADIDAGLMSVSVSVPRTGFFSRIKELVSGIFKKAYHYTSITTQWMRDNILAPAMRFTLVPVMKVVNWALTATVTVLTVAPVLLATKISMLTPDGFAIYGLGSVFQIIADTILAFYLIPLGFWGVVGYVLWLIASMVIGYNIALYVGPKPVDQIAQ